ncbi:dihydrolipoyl dehydrogenase family protein [Microbacterium terrisoli]|uniref:dihydrolipoyl dehydrogenase family protein n=1 Tax=Microbacterium terrisoli TaxID=3242192 RepID=UPI0028059475|nr:NAD(P)/FAD-dependent oxidoreductase [Microbacterium protaetiae]
MDTKTYDLIVIGAGPVGENVADRAVQGGLSAVIVENELVGGECSYWACIPSKALLRAPAALRGARDVDGAWQAVTNGLDAEGVFRRRDALTHDWTDDGQVAWLEGAGIDLVRGHGRLTGEREVTVTAPDGTTTTLHARHAVAVCTGTTAAYPDIPGLREARPWTSREAMSSHTVPDTLAIIGGGVVACETATVYSALGSTITMIVRSQLLRTLEPFAHDAVGDALVAAGVRIRTGEVTRVARDGDGPVTLTLDDGATVIADEVLVATGRAPRTDDIGMDVVGLAPGSSPSVDDTMRVDGVDWLYAVGDVNDRALLTHQGKYQARAAGDVIAARAHGDAVDAAPWGRHVATADHEAVPQVVFTDPEVASVGYTEADARAAGRDIRVVDYDLSGVAGAATHADHYSGHARAIVDNERDVLIGATFVGPDVAELLQSATIAVVGEVPIARLWHAVPAYPTLSEVWLRLLEELGRETA